MRIFVTGASGFVGSAVVQDLLRAGHQVTGLARSDAAARAIAAAGAAVHRGNLEDAESLRAGAAAAEGVIHTGFNHDFSRFAENCELDRRVIATLGAGLAGSDRPLVVTSGVALLPHGQLATEDMAPTGRHPRVASEEAARAVADRGVRVSIVRLPPTVHGDGDHGFVPLLITLAREKGVAAHVADGANRWSAVHRLDAAPVYRLALERAGAGATYHAVAEEGVPFRQIAEAIGRGLRLPVESRTIEQAAAHFGWFADFASMDVPTSSARTRRALGWSPRGPDLATDLAGPGYFAAPKEGVTPP